MAALSRLERFRPPGSPLGDGLVGLYDGVPELARAPDPSAPERWGFGPEGSARPLLELVAKLANCRDEVTGVVIGGAGAMWLSPEDWLHRVGDIWAPNNIPVEAFLDVAYGPEEDGVRRLRSFGMRVAKEKHTLRVADLTLIDS
ncbi:hypothetical protein [Myxococcus sp. Y35]|uniref:hypothetical protein n=1 Tax=Pseudomyxococcus flavus TaxID=3115648 RepID=UPI003CEBF0E0